MVLLGLLGLGMPVDSIWSSSYIIGVLVVLAVLALPAVYFLFLLDLTSAPNAPPRFPILIPALTGKFDLTRRGPTKLLRTAYDQLGDCFRLRVLHRHVTVMIGPDANKLVFEAKDDVLSQKEIYSFTVPVFGRNVVYDAHPKHMMQQLKFVNKGLNHVSMTGHCGKIVREAEEFFASWPESGTVDLLEEFSRLIILTASRCLLGDEIRENVQDEFAELYQQLSDGMGHLSVFAPNAPIPAHWTRDAARKKIASIFTPVIAARRQNPTVQHDDYLQVLIEAEYTDGHKLTDDEIVGILIATLFGGQHTSNITSTWMGLHIIRNKSTILPQILAEQKEVLSKHNGLVTLDGLGEMDLLNRCMKETLRMYPPLIILMRTALQSIQYRDYVIPKGDIVAVAPCVSHRLETVFSEPNEWQPDRFAPPRSEDSTKYAFLAFGGGRHGCLGERFAFLQVKTIWSTLSRKFDFELIDPLPEIDYANIVAGPKPPCRVRFQRKQDPFTVSNF